MSNPDILHPFSIISNGLLILPLFNNRQALFTNLANFKSFQSSMGRNLHKASATCRFLNNGRISHPYLITDTGRKISELDICGIHAP